MLEWIVQSMPDRLKAECAIRARDAHGDELASLIRTKGSERQSAGGRRGPATRSVIKA
jgi:hypothetical protein